MSRYKTVASRVGSLPVAVEEQYVKKCMNRLESRLLDFASMDELGRVRMGERDKIRAELAKLKPSDVAKTELLGRLEALAAEHELREQRKSILASRAQSIQAICQEVATDAIAVIYDIMNDDGQSAKARLNAAGMILKGAEGAPGSVPESPSALPYKELRAKVEEILQKQGKSDVESQRASGPGQSSLSRNSDSNGASSPPV